MSKQEERKEIDCVGSSDPHALATNTELDVRNARDRYMQKLLEENRLCFYSLAMSTDGESIRQARYRAGAATLFTHPKPIKPSGAAAAPPTVPSVPPVRQKNSLGYLMRPGEGQKKHLDPRAPERVPGPQIKR